MINVNSMTRTYDPHNLPFFKKCFGILLFHAIFKRVVIRYIFHLFFCFVKLHSLVVYNVRNDALFKIQLKSVKNRHFSFFFMKNNFYSLTCLG